MAYIDVDDILGMLQEQDVIDLTDDEDLGRINQDRVSAAIEQSDAETNGYLGVRYSVPLGAPVADIVIKVSTDIAIYNLYSRSSADEIPEVRRQRYLDAVKTLEKLSTGKIMLDVDPLPSPRELEEGSESNKPTDDNVFTRDKMEGF